MINNIEFSDLVLTWDVHEQANVEGKPRVKRIVDWFIARGGLVDSQPLPLCDYHIGGGYDKETKTFSPGTFRGKEINLLIEYKTFADYNNSKEDLNWKLFEAGKLCPEIALFVEENNIQLSFTDKGSFIKIPQVPDGTANITNYQGYKNQLDSFASDGIHIRTFQSENFFEEDVYSLLIYLAKDGHTGLHIKGKDFKSTMLNILCKFDGIGGVKANKLINVIPNLQMLIEYCNYDKNEVLESLIGVISAKTLRSFVNNQSRVVECRTQYNKIFGELPEPIKVIPLPEKAITKKQIKEMADAIYDYIKCYPDGREPQQICDYFNCGESSEDKKQLLICIKKLAELGKISSTIKGVFVAVKEQPQQSQSPIGCCVACADEHNSNTIKLINNVCPICKQDYSKDSKQIGNVSVSRAKQIEIENHAEIPAATPKEFVLSILGMHPEGILYTELCDIIQIRYPALELYYELITDIIQEGLCYEPRIGLLVGTHVSSNDPRVNGSQSSNVSSTFVTDIPGNIEHKEGGYGLEFKSNPINLDDPGISQSLLQKNIIPPPLILANCGDDNRTPDITPRTSDSFICTKEVIKSLDDIIVDFCYDNPKTDISILSYCKSKGYKIPEIHKAMVGLANTKLHRYKENGQETYSYKGLKAISEMDVGV